MRVKELGPKPIMSAVPSSSRVGECGDPHCSYTSLGGYSLDPKPDQTRTAPEITILHPSVLRPGCIRHKATSHALRHDS